MSILSTRNLALVRRRFAGIAAISVAVTFCSADSANATPGPAPSRPNVVIILADDLGWNDVSCYGDGRIMTPHIDALSREGSRFTNAHAPTSLCTPARYALLTGQYCWRTFLKSGVVAHNPLLIAPGSMTLPSLFRSGGYKTACIGKWHLGLRSNAPGSFDPRTHYLPPIQPGPNDVGFDYFFGLAVGHFFPPGVYLENRSLYNYDPRDPLVLTKGNGAGNASPETGARAARFEKEDVIRDLTQQAVKFITANQANPFFLYFAMSSPHDPYTPSSRFRGKSAVGDYGDFVMETDWAVGEIIKTIAQGGIAGHTLVIFTSDNGGEDASRPAFRKYGYNPNGQWRGDKGDIYEGGLRIPFIVRWPGRVAAGSSNDQLFGFNDLLATFAAMLEIDLPRSAGPDSYDVLEAWRGSHGLHPQRGLVVHSRGGLYGVIQGNWKYLHGQGNGERMPGGYPTPDQAAQGQLFNLSRDPNESRDVSSAHPHVVRKLHQLLQDYYLQGRSR